MARGITVAPWILAQESNGGRNRYTAPGKALESLGIRHDCKMGVQWGIPKTIGFNSYMVQCG